MKGYSAQAIPAVRNLTRLHFGRVIKFATEIEEVKFHPQELPIQFISVNFKYSHNQEDDIISFFAFWGQAEEKILLIFVKTKTLNLYFYL